MLKEKRKKEKIGIFQRHASNYNINYESYGYTKNSRVRLNYVINPISSHETINDRFSIENLNNPNELRLSVNVV